MSPEHTDTLNEWLKYFKAFLGFISGMIIILTIISIGTFILVALIRDSEGTAKNTCLQYEQAGVIEKGSCGCVEKIYKTWQESYDWKDACEILRFRNTAQK